MSHWLFKSEPSVWSWQQQVARGNEGEPWTGVRNHLAKKHMQAMKKGDQGFFYHSNEGKEIVGIVEVIEEYAPDPTDESGKFGMVTLKAVRALGRPVTLAEIRTMDKLSKMSLVTCPRLSVQPVSTDEWDAILALEP